MKHVTTILGLVVTLGVSFCTAQDFDPTPVTFTPNNLVEFKLNLPIVHLSINNYVPSQRLVYAGQTITFHFYTRQNEWPEPNIFLRVRWDDDFDASNGISWSDWEMTQDYGHYGDRTKVFATPGSYTLTFELKLANTAGQEYTWQKQYDIRVAPLPTAVYHDNLWPANDQLYYWAGTDNVLNRPVLLLPGYDPGVGGTDPGLVYAQGFDLIQQARSQGYDVFIMRWGNGGRSIALNKDVFLGACSLLHNLLGSTEAALQVAGFSMGGVVARYGLAYAEDNRLAPDGPHPGQYIEHYVNTFISFDAPQQGAHVNTNLQGLLRDYGNPGQQYILQATALNKCSTRMRMMQHKQFTIDFITTTCNS